VIFCSVLYREIGKFGRLDRVFWTFGGCEGPSKFLQKLESNIPNIRYSKLEKIHFEGQIEGKFVLQF